MASGLDCLSKMYDGARWILGDNGSVGVGNVDWADTGVATMSSSAAVELPPLAVRANARLRGFSRSPPKCHPSVHAWTSITSSTGDWRVDLFDGRAGSAVLGRFIDLALPFEWDRLCVGADRGRGGTSSAGGSLGGIFRILFDVRVGSTVRARFLFSPVALYAFVSVGAEAGRRGMISSS